MLSPDFAEALTFAAHLHSAQTRKGTDIPYISHLLIVAGLVLEYAGNEDEAIAALLHNAVEDQGGQSTLERVWRRFGSAVASVVEACSDADVEPKPEWRPRKEAYLAHIGEASGSTRLVGAADNSTTLRPFSVITGAWAKGFGKDSTAARTERFGTTVAWLTRTKLRGRTPSWMNWMV